MPIALEVGSFLCLCSLGQKYNGRLEMNWEQCATLEDGDVSYHED